VTLEAQPRHDALTRLVAAIAVVVAVDRCMGLCERSG
jgi:hypothetical protein